LARNISNTTNSFNKNKITGTTIKAQKYPVTKIPIIANILTNIFIVKTPYTLGTLRYDKLQKGNVSIL
jgi:hypothetical protein